MNDTYCDVLLCTVVVVIVVVSLLFHCIFNLIRLSKLQVSNKVSVHVKSQKL